MSNAEFQICVQKCLVTTVRAFCTGFPHMHIFPTCISICNRLLVVIEALYLRKPFWLYGQPEQERSRARGTLSLSPSHSHVHLLYGTSRYPRICLWNQIWWLARTDLKVHNWCLVNVLWLGLEDYSHCQRKLSLPAFGKSAFTPLYEKLPTTFFKVLKS